MEFVLETIAKATLLLGMIVIVLYFSRGASAGFRHLLISLGMIALLGLPLLTYFIPNWQIRILPVAERESVSQKPVERVFIAHDGRPEQDLQTAGPVSVSGTVRNKALLPEVAVEIPAKSRSISWPYLLFGVWLTGCMIMLVRIGRGLYQLHLYRSTAIPFPIAAHRPLDDLLQRFNVKGLSVLFHPTIPTPITWTAWNPVILLPAPARYWSQAELEVVVLHELAHIRRKDFYFHLISLFTLAIYWFHPLLWWLNKRYLLEREKACDEAVIQTGVNAVHYAEKLLAIAKRLLPARSSASVLALQMAQPSLIKTRIVAALEVAPFTRGISGKNKWTMILICLLLIPLLAAIHPSHIPAVAHFPVLQNLVKKAETSSALAAEIAIRDKEDPLNSARVPSKENNTLISSDRANQEARPLTPAPSETIEKLQPIAGELPELVPDKAPALAFKLMDIKDPEGLYGQWRDGRSQFRVWIKGSYNLLPVMPYIEATTPEDMVVIEEQTADRINRLVITRAPFYGSLIQSYIGDMPNSWSQLSQNEPLYLWTVNDEWRFLGKGREAWMRRNLEAVMLRIKEKSNSVWQVVDASDVLWNDMINAQEAFKAERFVRRSETKAWFDAAQNKMTYRNDQEKKPVYPLSQLPLRAYDRTGGHPGHALVTVGAETPLKVTFGWTGGDHRGERYGVLIYHRSREGELQAFNFHLRYNQCKNAEFQLHFFEVEDGIPVARLTDEVIVLEIGDQEGWIRKDLSSYHLPVKKDILVVLELLDYHGKRGGGLFFSHASRSANSGKQLDENYKWDFAALSMAANLEIAN